MVINKNKSTMSTQPLTIQNDASPQNVVTNHLTANRGTFKETVTFGLGVNELDAVTGVFNTLSTDELTTGKNNLNLSTPSFHLNLVYQEAEYLNFLIGGVPGTRPTTNIYFSRIGKVVTCRIMNFLWNASNVGTWIPYIEANPGGFASQPPVRIVAPIMSNGAQNIGMVEINFNSTIYFYGSTGTGIIIANTPDLNAFPNGLDINLTWSMQ
jgi:hypothetical protein